MRIPDLLRTIDVPIAAGKIWLNSLFCRYLLRMCAGAHPSPRNCDNGGAGAVFAQEEAHVAACRQPSGRGRSGCAPRA